MKISRLALKLLLLALIAIFTLCSCDIITDALGGTSSGTDQPAEHEHYYAITVTEPTCTEDGFTRHICSCGDEYKDNITSKKGHNTVTDKAVAPTCTTDGLTEGKHCSVCGTVTLAQSTVEALGHNIVTDKAVAPTCTKSGLTEGKHCSVCGTVTLAQTAINATGHSFTDGVCTDCGFSTPSGGEFNYADVPEWSGENYVIINGGIPYFTEDEITDVSFENYSELDSLGRAQVAFASLGTDLMPTGSRPSISYKPTGWVQETYPTNVVPQGQIYNRSHLIAWSLAGEGNNEKNLITGTPYFNQIGMQKFEPLILDYIRETGNHVMYRVTPIFVGEELVARGVLMEAWSVEDDGEGICFNVFMYNVQPGITINYLTGENYQTPSDDTSDDTEKIIATLVTDISQLKAGDKIIIVAKGYDYALGAMSSSGNNRVAVEITKNGSEVVVSSGVEIITLENGITAGTYAFRVGDKYIYAASSASNHLKEQAVLNENGSWSISIANGVATIKATGSNSRNWLRYNNTNKLFSAYGSGQNDVCIYVITEQ